MLETNISEQGIRKLKTVSCIVHWKRMTYLVKKYTATTTLCSDQATSGVHSNGAVASNDASGTSYVTGEIETT